MCKVPWRPTKPLTSASVNSAVTTCLSSWKRGSYPHPPLQHNSERLVIMPSNQRFDPGKQAMGGELVYEFMSDTKPED